MSLLGLDLGNHTETFREIFREDNFDPVRARNAMAILCPLYFQENKVETDPGLSYCNATHDSFSCWPTTQAGKTAEIRCPDYSFSDPNKNTTRFCLENSTWSLEASYNNCYISTFEPTPIDDRIQRVIYYIGYSITTISLVIAFTIFVYFRSLRCLRNTIHCHLIAAFFFNNLSYIALANTILHMYDHPNGWICRAVMTVCQYLMSVPYYWMFVEGLYLYTTVVWAFTLQKIKLWYYIVIGWGTPLIFAITWACVRAEYHDVQCWFPIPEQQEIYHFGYIIYGPIIVVMLINVFFIMAIVGILVTKLRASNTLETRRTRKTVRAMIVLLPLLGLTFVLFLRPPVPNIVARRVFQFANTIMQSLQGLFVAVIYCFMNGEVKTVLRKKFVSFRDSRSLTRYTKSSIFSSPHRSSGYAMHQLSVPCHGKSNSDAKRAINDRRFSKLSRTEESETDACTSMIDNGT